MKKLIFVNSGILIAASRGNSEMSQYAMEILDDPDVEFASSIFVKLEVLPKPLYQNNNDEALFYETFFESVTVWTKVCPRLIQNAYKEAVKSGLSALDSLHIVSAASVGADEFITTEKRTSSIHRSKLVPIATISLR